MRDGIYQRRNSGAVGSSNVVTNIRVENDTITEAWNIVPGGEYRGNDPVGYNGLNATKIIDGESSPWKWYKVG